MPDSDELIAYRNSRPAKRMGAGALVRDAHGRVLLVEPIYKDRWEVPGGSVEADESPRAACERELREELSLDLPLGRLLVMEWQGPEPSRTESIMFLYDGGLLGSRAIRLPPEELRSFAFVESQDLDQYVAARLAGRIRAALVALDQGRLVEMENGTFLGQGVDAPSGQ